MSLVTLTFDNGPSVGTTPLVLEHLHARNLTAYFCLIGKQLAAGNEQVDIAKATLASGHRLVNHSLTHTTALGDDPSPSHATREVCEMDALLDDTLGDWGEKWFRPSGRGGELGKHVFSKPALDQLQALRYSLLLWNCVPRDWEDHTGWVDTALQAIDSQDHTVIVLHDLDTGAMDLLPHFLDTLLARGDIFTTTLPIDCVPMRDGALVWTDTEFAELIA